MRILRKINLKKLEKKRTFLSYLRQQNSIQQRSTLRPLRVRVAKKVERVRAMTIEMMLEEWWWLMVLKVGEMGGICRVPKSFFNRIPYATM